MKKYLKVKNFKIVFFGTPKFSVPCFLSLYKAGYNIPLVVTQPDRPKGRGKHISPTPVKIAALKKNIKCIQPEKLEENFIKMIEKLNPDILLVVAYGKFLPKKLLNIPRLGTLNIHPSLLPKYRGPSPIQYALLNGEKITGVSLMILDSKIDHGSIISQIKIGIDDNDTAISLSDKLTETSVKLLQSSLLDYLNSDIKPKAQNHIQATFSKLIQKQDALIDFNKPAEKIINKVRAYQPWPLAEFKWDDKIIKIHQAILSNKNLRPGEFLFDKDKKEMHVGTGKKSFQILKLQLPGKNKINAKDFINSLK